MFVLNIARLRAGRENYYLSQVTDGAEDQYLHSGEAPGRWLGDGVAVLGLAGEVDNASSWKPGRGLTVVSEGGVGR